MLDVLEYQNTLEQETDSYKEKRKKQMRKKNKRLFIFLLSKNRCQYLKKDKNIAWLITIFLENWNENQKIYGLSSFSWLIDWLVSL